MSKAMLLASAALVLVATAADARPQTTLSKDNRITILPGTALPHAMKFLDGTKYLFTNFATKDKEGVYLGGPYALTITGPSSFLGAAYGVAEQFTLRKSASVTTLAAGMGSVSGNDSVTMTLYADNGSNSPGTVLASGTGTTTTQSGSCCAVTSVTIPSVSLNARTPYWIGITTTGNNYETAAFQVLDQVDESAYVAYTTDGGSTWGGGLQMFGAQLPAIGIK